LFSGALPRISAAEADGSGRSASPHKGSTYSVHALREVIREQIYNGVNPKIKKRNL